MSILAAVAALAFAAGTPDKLFVSEPRVVNVEPQSAAILRDRIAEELQKRPELSLVTLADIEAVLSAAKTRELLSCDDEQSCLSELSRAAASKLVLTSSLGKIGSSIVMTLNLVDIERGEALGRVSETGDDIAAVAQALPHALGVLFGWESDAAAVKFTLPADRKLSFAVFDLTASGVAPEIAQNLIDVLSVEVKRIEGATVISRADINAMLQMEKVKDVFGCAADASCLAEIGGALGVDKLIVGQVGSLGGNYLVSLRLIDAQQVRVDNRVSETFKGDEAQLIRATRQAVRRLLGIETAKGGSLVVTASQSGAQVFLDNELAGLVPVPPLSSVAAGRHSLRLARDGFFDWQSDVYVDPGDTTAVWAELSERPEKWYQKWWVWAIAGVIVAGATVTAIVATSGEPPLATGTVTATGF